jgi:5'-nucleotidase
MENKLVCAVSSRALFNLEDGNRVYESEGPEAFDAYMRKNEKKPLRPGVAYNLVRKLLNLNTPGGERDKVEVVLLSRNSPEAGLRVMHSIRHLNLDIERAVFTQGTERFRYAKALGTHLFLSANAGEVKAALQSGIAAATIMPNSAALHSHDGEVRFAFDGDAVLFSDEAERINLQEGLAAFQKSEQDNALAPLAAGPFKPVLQALHAIQSTYPANESPLKVALVTARGIPAHERVLRTLRNWNIRVDEAVFCAGMIKGPFLEAFGADFFFDDAQHNVDYASAHVPSGHVPSGVRNEPVTA